MRRPALVLPRIVLLRRVRGREVGGGEVLWSESRQGIRVGGAVGMVARQRVEDRYALRVAPLGPGTFPGRGTGKESEEEQRREWELESQGPPVDVAYGAASAVLRLTASTSPRRGWTRGG